jgi:hypothetical protein
MLKKLFLWSLYAAFLGVLLAGAAYRTSIKLPDNGQGQNRGKASNNQSSDEVTLLPSVEQKQSIMEGRVIEASNRGLSVQLLNGQALEVSGRAWHYLQGFGFNAQNGDPLQLEGFYENGSFEVSRMTNLNTAQSALLRDESGHPLWRGKE